MAEKIKIAELEIDDAKLLRSLSETKKAIEELSDVNKELRKDGEGTSESFVENEAKIKSLREEYGRQIKVLQATQKSQQDLDNSVKKNIKTIRDAQDNNRELVKVRNELNASTAEGRKQIEEINKKINQNNDFIKKNTSEVEQNRQNVGNYSSALTGAIGKVKAFTVALAATGIGLIIAALKKLGQAFMQNQQVANFVTTAVNALSLVLNDIVDFVVKNFSVVTDFFKNPMEGIKNLGQAIKDNLIERFNSLLDTFGYLGTALKELFSGNFTEAANAAKMAGKELVDVMTGVNNSVDKAIELGSAYGESLIKRATDLTQFANAAKIAQAQLAGLIQGYEREAEALRAQRDDITLSYEERKKASAALLDVLKKEEEAELRMAQVSLQAALANEANGDSIEGTTARIEAENKLAEIRNRIQTRYTEQLKANNALNKEETDKAIANEVAYIATLESLQQSAREREGESLDAEAERNFQRRLSEIDNLKITEAQKTELLALAEAERAAQIEAIDEESKKKRIENEEELASKIISSKKDTLDAALQLAGQESALGKAILAAKKVLALQEWFIEQKKAKAEAILKAKSATADVASGTAKTASSTPFPFNIPLIAGFIAQTAGVVGTIAGALKGGSAPKFAVGGVLSGPSHAHGGIKTPYGELEGGEAVINKRSTALFKPLLSQINQAGGGRKFANGGILGEESLMSGSMLGADRLAQKIAEANMSLPAPQVSVEEISGVGRRVSVIETTAKF